MAEVNQAQQPGQAIPAPGLGLPIPNQGIPDLPLMELAAQANAGGGPDMGRTAELVGQMMQLAAQLAVADPIFVGPASQFARTAIDRLGFAARPQSLPGFPPLPGLPATPGLPPLPPGAPTSG